MAAPVRRFLLVPVLVPLALAASGAGSAFAFWEVARPLGPKAVFVLEQGGIRTATVEAARREGLLVVDLSDEWAPFIFSNGDGDGKRSKPNPYRKTFVTLANDRATPEELFLESPAGQAAVVSTVPAALRSQEPGTWSPDEQHALERARRTVVTERSPSFLEVYGIPPTLSVLARRVARDAAKTCYGSIDSGALRALDAEIGFQSREQARVEYEQAVGDAAWVSEGLAALGENAGEWAPEAATAKLRAEDAGIDLARLDRYQRGQKRLLAVRAVQDRLVCEGLLSPERFTPGAFDLATHLALAEFERENAIFGWGFVSGETKEALLRSPSELHLDTLHRILAERVADAAGIVEDGSASKGAEAASYVDEAGRTQPVPNLIGEFVAALASAMQITTPDDMAAFLRGFADGGFARFAVAFRPPPLPPYYAPVMDLTAEIDRGDVWYDPPLDARGKPRAQARQRYPSFTLFVSWRGQKIPLVRWRTTIGSWRSELGADGHVYLRYKNSDVGPRIWKNIVAAPVWVPPDGTPAKDLLIKKVFDRRRGAVDVVNTELMGPGFASAYGLVMAIHLKKLENGGLFDNQIRTHGSVDYTSIARRFSHGCHRLVNNRAVRLFDFVLRHRKFVRLGNRAVDGAKRRFSYRGHRYEYALTTRGYYFDLRPPLPVNVLEGRLLGAATQPIRQYVRKPGIDYGPLTADGVEMQPVVGP
jgi:hypothetical protein